MNNTSKNENLNTELIMEKTKDNFRAIIIDLGLEVASKYSTTNSYNALEIGCMFKSNEGFSTFRISHFMNKINVPKRFISIECESEHIDSCKKMLFDLNPDLLHEVQFLCGRSLDMLPNAIHQMGSVDLILLDGGGSPECCLRELEMVIPHLSENGMVIIDDLHDMAPTEAYPYPRLFGKGTLILPYMIIAEYLKVRNISHPQKNGIPAIPTKTLNTTPIAQTSPDELLELLGDFGYLVISKDYHKMLLIGKRRILERFRCQLATKGLSQIEVAPMGMFVEAPANSNQNNDTKDTSGRHKSILCNTNSTATQEQTPVTRKNLGMFANKYNGRRAFIIGNGPSLNNMDLTKLRDEVTFGVNSIFYNFEHMGFKPTFYVVEDKLVAEDRADEISKLTGMIKIFGTELQYCLKDTQDTIWANVIYDFSNYPGFPHFSKDASQCLWVGGTVSYLCMQLAYYMGFNEVYLIGFDHNYTIPSDANVEGTVITSSSNDPNHFHPEYFGKGKRWHDPRLDRMEKAYNKAKEAFEANGRRIYNATKGGKLEVFPRVEYDSLFNTSNANQLSFKNLCTCSGNPAQSAQNPELCKSEMLKYRPDKPFSHLVLDYTRLCNSRCTYCGIWKSKNEPELSLETIEKTFASLKTYGLSTCYITGGEPYISDKVLDIARIMHQYLPKCRLSGATNAVQPQQVLTRLDKILRMGIPLQVHVSINGSEATHDATRGCPGFWKKAVYLLDTLKANGVKVVASMSLMPQTIRDLPYMQEFCAERGIELMFSWVRQSPRYGTVDEYYSIWPEELKSQLHKIEYLPDEFDCVGLSDRLVVVPDGSVYPCEVYHPEILLGNVNEQPLESMLNSPRAASMARMITDKKCYWCQGAGDTDSSPKWMLMDCYRRHAKQAVELAQKYPQAVRMPPHESRKVIEEILSCKSTHHIPSTPTQQNSQVVNCDNKENKVRVSIIVCTHRNPDLLAKTLESLSRQSINKELLEIIVVDNNSQDNTANVVASYPSVRYLLEEKLGLSHARNAGIKIARGDIIAFIDDDAEASPDWAQALLRIYDSIPQVWAVGGKVLPIWDAEQPLWLTEEHHRFLSLVEWGQAARPLRWPERIIGTNCSFRRGVFEDIGYFNTDLGRLGGLLLSLEDTEIQQRIHQTAHLVYYSPEATVYHHVPAGRMTKEYLSKRTIGNAVSEMLLTLRQTGKDRDAGQFLDWVRSVSTKDTGESSCNTEEQILEKAFSTFVLGQSEIPIESKITFVTAIGTYYSKQQKYEQALNKYTQALSLPNLPKPKVCVFFVRMGNIFLEQEMYEQAEQKFNESLSIEQISDETKFYSLKGIGICCGHRGQFELMERKYEEILAQPDIPENEKVDAMRAFGQCYFKHQRYKEAEYVYLRMAGQVKDTHSYQILKGLGLSYAAQNRFEEMETKLDEILTCGDFSSTRKTDAVLCFGRFYLENKKYQQAEQLYLKIKSRIQGREKYQILKALGITYGCQGRLTEMMQIIDEIMISEDIHNDDKADAAISFGRHYLENGNYKQAEQLYFRILNQAQGENKYQILRGLGDCYGVQGRYSEMEQKFKDILTLQEIPDDMKVDATLCFCRYYYAQGLIEPAEIMYSKIYSLENLDNLGRYHLVLGYGNIFYGYGKLSQAREKFDQALSINNVSQEERFWVLAALARLDLAQDRFSQAQQCFQELFFSDIYTNRQKVVLASDFVNYYATRGNRDKIMEIYKQVCSLNDITLDDKSLFAHRVKEALQHVQDNPQLQNTQPVIQERIDKPVRISVIVCTYRNPELLTKTLDSLSRQTLNQDLFEIIVVDNNSQDSTPNVVSRYRSARYIQEQKQGLSFARNTGIQQSKGQIVAFIDDDAEASPGWLEALLNVYDNNPQVWAVGGKVLPIWDADKPQWLNESYHRALSLLDWGDIPKPLQWPERIIGANCSFRKDVFSTIGFFNTNLGRISDVLLASEDIEIQERIHSLNHQVYYAPEAIVYHHVPASRMTREHFYQRRLGNILSLTIKSLLSQGKDNEVEMLVSNLTNPHTNFSNDIEKNQNTVNILRQALELLHKSHDSFLNVVKSHIQTASDAIRRRNWEVAETFLRVYIDLQPDNSDAYSTLCALYEAQDDIEAANKIRRESEELSPGHTSFSSVSRPGENTANVTLNNSSSISTGRIPTCRYLFAASNDSHVGWMIPIAERMDGSRFMVFPAKNENAEFYLQKNQKQFIQYQPGILKTLNPSVIVFGCDWGGNEQQAVQEAKSLSIPTVCIQEGCLDFQNPQTRRMTRADYAFLQGPVMQKYIQRTDNIIITGNPKYDNLYETPLPEKVTVMINSNFTYGIYEEARDRWVRDVAETCKELGLDFFISQHPRDFGIFPPEYKLVKSDAFKMQQQLQNTSILISRFSTIIYEALAMGREAIYYNPHHEHFRIFAQDDTGGIRIANDLSQLKSAMETAINNLGQDKENKRKFLLQHCTTLNHDAAIKCADALHAIADKRISTDLNTQRQNTNIPQVYEIKTCRSDMSNPLVSVIIPAYNAAGYIAKSLESVLAQSYRNFELLIINDGSTDKTEEIVLGYKDPRIRYYRQENRGLAATHNLGIQQSHGEFVIKLDADDMMTPDFITMHIQEFDKHPEADLVYCDDCLIDVDGRQIKVIEYPEYTDRKTLIRDLFRSGYTIVPFRTCIRKNVFDKIGLFDESLIVGEDYDMMRRFAKHGLKIHHLRSAIYQRRMGSDSLSRTLTQSKADTLYTILKRYVDTFTYEELFPDVAWENIAPEKRQLHGKCFVAATYLSMGELNINANSSPIYIKKAFERAHSELNECLKLDPDNQQIRQLIQKCAKGLQQYNTIIPQTVGSNY